LDLSEERVNEVGRSAAKPTIFSSITPRQGLCVVAFLCWSTAQAFTVGDEQTVYGAIAYWSSRSLIS
jgi:hypothetical protein